MSDLRRFLVLLNQEAGGVGQRRLAQVLNGSGGIGPAATVVPVSNLAEAREALARCDAATIPVIAGGDGTANLVVRALRESGQGSRPLGLLPLGTGNALAHSLGLNGLERALAVLRRGVPRALDLMATDHPDCPIALMSLSAGFEAAFIAAFVRRRPAGRLGLLAAATAALQRSYDDIRFEVDGHTLAEPGAPVYVVGLYNLICYGFGRRMIPWGDLADGWGDAIVHHRALSYWRTLLRPGDRGPPRGIHQRWRAARFAAERFQVDGEPLQGREITVSLEPGAYSVLAPSAGDG